jgi:tellurite resistance protein TerC
VPPWVSLAVTVVFLIAGIAYSLWRTRGTVPEAAHGHDGGAVQHRA